MTKKLLVTILALLLVIAFSGSAFASAPIANIEEAKVEETQNLDLKIVSITDYDKMDEKQKDEYIAKYCAVIEESINSQMKNVYKTFINELTDQREFTEAAELTSYVSSHRFSLNIDDANVRSKLELSLEEPVVFKDPNPFISTSRGVYMSKTDPGYFAYAGRTISHSVYSKVYSTTGTYKGSPYKSYDVAKYYYTWEGNYSHKDRVDYVESGVRQSDPKKYGGGKYVFNTGWPEHHSSGSFVKYASTINLPAGRYYTDTYVGGAAAGGRATATFSNGAVSKVDSVKTNWGGIVWYV